MKVSVLQLAAFVCAICKNGRWAVGTGGHGAISPPDFGRSGNPIKFRGGQIMPTTLLLAPLVRNFRPSYGPGREENLDKIPNGNTFLALACLDLVKTFIATLLRFVILANSKQA